jgi:hypothetical protein
MGWAGFSIEVKNINTFKLYNSLSDKCKDTFFPTYDKNIKRNIRNEKKDEIIMNRQVADLR